MGNVLGKADGRRSCEAASFDSPGCSAAEPWVNGHIELSAPTGRHSPEPVNDGIATDAVPAIGMTLFQSYNILRLHETQGFILGYRITPRRAGDYDGL
jgi:hypothetical protein